MKEDKIRSESPSGISISEQEAASLDQLISPLLQKGQSIHHICTNHRDSILFSEKSICNYIDVGIFSARNLDLPRKVKFHPRKTNRDSFKVARSRRTLRTYQHFGAFLDLFPDTPLVELDSVEGGKDGKVLLTIHFVESQFMLAFLRERNDSQSVIDIFDRLYWELRPDIFQK